MERAAPRGRRRRRRLPTDRRGRRRTGAARTPCRATRRSRPGQTVVVDAGCAVDGYCSDCTRTFATGPLPDRLREAYEVCLDAQLAALGGVRAGASGQEVDAVARGLIDGDRLRAARSATASATGSGCEVHEAPGCAPRARRTTLEAGNVVTVEPGIYLEGEGGIRIEDLVVVTRRRAARC